MTDVHLDLEAVEERDPGGRVTFHTEERHDALAGAPAPIQPDALDQSVVEEGKHLWTPYFFGGLFVVLVGGVAARYLSVNVPKWTADGGLSGIGASIEYPIYAIALGLLLNWLLRALGLRDKLSSGFRTEFFIKTGLVLLGATILITTLVSAAPSALVQGVIMITCVFGFTWFLAGKLGLDDRLRALLATAVSICGVSAAIAAAGAVRAKREQLAYAAGLVIIFALPSIFILPWLAGVMGLNEAVTGAWLGGNIDTTAAVAAAGAIAGENALKVATIVKMTQNALIGVVAVLLTAWFAFRVDKTADKPRPIEIWYRFPKFVLGFIAASIIATVWLSGDPEGGAQFSSVVKTLNQYFLTLAFVSIGLEFKVTSIKQAGWRPILVFGAAAVFNLLLALGVSSLLFHDFVVAS
ncbi:MAG: YeiH family protein [Propionibacteriaceae bacterium]|jgi:uncharacterized integral membrane protein (TIGR00698 family)|nr:YeiH family protein [Propionibacteriaceae bacterium]